MPTDVGADQQTALDVVRRAYLVLVAAHEHFQCLFSSLPIENQTTFRATIAPETQLVVLSHFDFVLATKIRQPNGKRPPKKARTATRRHGSELSLKDIILSIVKRNPEGLTLRQLLEATEKEYRPKRTSNVRHVVRTVINQLVRSRDVLVAENGLHQPLPF